MQLTAKCPECGHEFQQDSMYLGIKRTCPECEEVFLFDVKEGGEDGRSLTARDFGMTRIACTSCYRVSNLNPQYEDMDMVPCGFCGAKIPSEYGKKFVNILETVEAETTRLYLAGEAHSQISAHLVPLGMGEESAAEYVELLQVQVPFIRYDVVCNGNEPQVDVHPACNCDICSAHLHGEEQNIAYDILWEKVQYGEDEGQAAAGAAFGLVGVLAHAALTEGGGGGGGSSAKSEKFGLYFLCEACKKSMKAWMFNCYRGFPVSDGFKMKRMAPMQI